MLENENRIEHIYDKIFKKVLTLSSVAVTNLINGLFNTDYPPKTSTVTYNWTEFHDEKLRKTLADTIVTINGEDAYHMEAQMTSDKDIVFRVFSYGYGHADRMRISTDDNWTLHFPEPVVIYLYSPSSIPDFHELTLDFGKQGMFNYKVPTVKFTDVSTEEINNKKMVILIPFALLRVRDIMERERSPENLEKLSNIINHDIIESIETNFELGNITLDDARRLKRYTKLLYEHLYAHYDEMEAMNDMTDESLIIDLDIRDEVLKDKDRQIDEMQKQLGDNRRQLDAKDAIIDSLRKQLAEKS